MPLFILQSSSPPFLSHIDASGVCADTVRGLELHGVLCEASELWRQRVQAFVCADTGRGLELHGVLCEASDLWRQRVQAFA